MVIGVEGNVHVGKTTFINNNFSKFIIIKETKFKQDLNDYDRQLYYIKSEIEKKKNLGVNTIIDRTIISTIIYTIYTETLSSTEKNKIIFVEVKARTNLKYGRPAEAVTKTKQIHIEQTAQYYVCKNKLENKQIRFDVVEVYLIAEKYKIKHIKNAI